MQRKTTLDYGYDLFVLDCQSRRLTDGTLQFYKAKLCPFIRWCQGQGIEYLPDIEAVHIRKYLVSIAERDLSEQYQDNIARAIRAWLNYCIRDELIEKNPFDKVKMTKLSKKILPALTEDEIKTVLHACNTKRDEAICLFLLDSGVRVSELCALNIASVNMKSGAVGVKQGKGKKDRTTYVGARTRKALLRYLATRNNPASNAPLFLGRYGERLTVSGMVQLMDRLRERSGVANLNCHTFRRTMAINAVRNGMNVHVLARMLGHADIQMLRRYLDINVDDLADAHREHGPVDNMKL